MKILSRNPILVTGIHRSGTTWVGNMLALAPRVIYIDEIFNPRDGLLQHRKIFDVYFKYLKDNKDAHNYKRILEDAFDFHSRRAARNLLEYLLRRPLLKDPIAVFSSEWLSENFSMDVVILIRHPAAFVSSLKRLNWRFDFKNFVTQTSLMSRYLRQYEEMIMQTHSDIVEEASVLWLCIYSVVDNFISRNPDWIVKRLEDISIDPLKEYRDMYKKLGLLWNKKIENTITRYSNEFNPVEAPGNIVHYLKRNSKQNTKSWKKMLNGDEIDRIIKIVEPFASKYYCSHDW